MVSGKSSVLWVLVTLILGFCSQPESEPAKGAFEDTNRRRIAGVNESVLPVGEQTLAIVGATLIDGTGKPPIENAVVIVENNLVAHVGEANSTKIPDDAEVLEAAGLTLVPGLIDAHFHLDGNNNFPNLFLRHGVTSVRDPGAWIESYSNVRQASQAIPRLFLTGPHFDMPPAAYPHNSILIRDAAEAVNAVNRFAEQGASAFKVYFRLTPEITKVVCQTAHQLGLPVTAHLEITSAYDAIHAGVDGIEHVTSFGTSLLSTYEAEQYRQAVFADNNARRDGRYQTWNLIEPEGPKADSLISFLLSKGTVHSPTLGAFEYRLGPDKTDSVKINAFRNMIKFTGYAHRAGVKTVVGSHSWVPYAKVGWAFQHEMELLAESGIGTMDIIVGATLGNARFLRIEDRLGSIEKGKLADLVLIEGDPTLDIKAFYDVRKVMTNGVWLPTMEEGADR